MNISVCMATYNGEKYVHDQLESILKQLSDDDEVIICDDQSTDKTIQRVKAFDDSRIKLYKNEYRLGYVRNFERALNLASGDYIFLADQDDIWPDGRVSTMLNDLELGGVIVGNLISFPCGSTMGKIETFPANSFRSIINILLGKVPYYGSAMAMKRAELDFLLPFPKAIEAHDLWIALNANIRGVMIHSPSLILHRRLHDNNTSPRTRRSLLTVLRARFLMFRHIIKSFFQR